MAYSASSCSTLLTRRVLYVECPVSLLFSLHSRRGGTGRRDGLKIHNWAVSWRLIAVVKKPASPVFMQVRGRQASVYGG